MRDNIHGTQRFERLPACLVPEFSRHNVHKLPSVALGPGPEHFFDIDPKLVIDKKRGLREILIENQVNIT